VFGIVENIGDGAHGSGLVWLWVLLPVTAVCCCCLLLLFCLHRRKRKKDEEDKYPAQMADKFDTITYAEDRMSVDPETLMRSSLPPDPPAISSRSSRSSSGGASPPHKLSLTRQRSRGSGANKFTNLRDADVDADVEDVELELHIDRRTLPTADVDGHGPHSAPPPPDCIRCSMHTGGAALCAAQVEENTSLRSEDAFPDDEELRLTRRTLPTDQVEIRESQATRDSASSVGSSFRI
jgi:hypothetical protein